jgi:hypothetical protein
VADQVIGSDPGHGIIGMVDAPISVIPEGTGDLGQFVALPPQRRIRLQQPPRRRHRAGHWPTRQFDFQLGHAPLERCEVRRPRRVAPWLAPVAFTVSALVRVMAAVAVAVMPNAW